MPQSNEIDYRNYWDYLAVKRGVHGAVTHLTVDEYRDYYVHILSQLAPATVGSVIDFACGPALLRPIIRELWPKAGYHGFDISPQMIAAARKRHDDATFSVVDGPDFKGMTADFITVHSLFTHIWPEDASEYLAAIRQALNPGGRASVSIHTNTKRDWQGAIPRIDYRPEHFEAMLADSGLVVVDKADGIQRYYAVECNPDQL